MCGFAGVIGTEPDAPKLTETLHLQRHRGPDDDGVYIDPVNRIGLAHNRLSILDLSEAGHQPMSNDDGSLWIVYNGEIYNHIELRRELNGYPFRSQSDTEVILAAYQRWGTRCLEHFIGMFSFIIWDEREKRLFGARDRFGVKPLYYAVPGDDTLIFASEIKVLAALGFKKEPCAVTWATYLTFGVLDHCDRTFWEDVHSLAPGHFFTWQNGRFRIQRWYDLAQRVGDEEDSRSDDLVAEEYIGLLIESVKWRFRSDVPLGVNLSGGLDSSLLIGLIRELFGRDFEITAFTFVTGDPEYDELPWVRAMTAHTRYDLQVCTLSSDEVPELARAVQWYQDEPFGGVPTLAYAKLFETARSMDVIVLLDGQGMDEQWAGYDYYCRTGAHGELIVVQGSKTRPVRPECLHEAFRAFALEPQFIEPFSEPLRNMQYRDIRYSKIPRALRYNDRISMRSSTELREPFLDHRLVELALRQRRSRKIFRGIGKYFLRRMARKLLPENVRVASKRVLQTPQREWLRGPLRAWAGERIEAALDHHPDWLESKQVRKEWDRYCSGQSDNSYYVWQWINLGLACEQSGP